MNKRNLSLMMLLVIFLFQACQESPTQTGEVDDSNEVAQQTNGPDRLKTYLGNPGNSESSEDCIIYFDGDDCCEDETLLGDCDVTGGGGGGSSNSPNMMYFNQGVSDQDLYYSFNSITFSNPSQINWSGNVETPNTAQAQFGPTAVHFNNKVYAFYQRLSNINDNIWFSSTSTNSISWSANNILPVGNGTITNGAPAAIEFNGKMYVFFVAPTKTDIRYTTSTDGITWTNHVSIVNNVDEVENVYPVVFNNKLYVFYTGINNSPSTSNLLNVYTTDGSSWTINPYSTPASFEGAPVVLGNTLYLIYMDGSNNLRSTSTTNVQGWGNNVPILSAKTVVRPTAIAKNGYIIVLYKGATQTNIHMAYSNNGTSWSGNTHVPGQTFNSPYLISID